jgi:hypothetical protein
MMQATTTIDDITFDVVFDFEAGEPATSDCPGWPDEITLQSVKIAGFETIEILTKRVLDDLMYRMFDYV